MRDRRTTPFSLDFWRDQSGTVLPVLIIFLGILTLGLAILLDWSRVQIHYRGLQTAADAAATSAAMAGERWTQIRVTRYRTYWDWYPCNPDAEGNYEQCWYTYRVYDNIPAMDGPDEELFRNQGWGPEGWKTRARCADYSYCEQTVTDRWIRFDATAARRAAQEQFDENARLMSGGGGQKFAWRLVQVTIRDNVPRGFPAAPEPGWCSRVLDEDSVEVEAYGVTTFSLLPAFGLTHQDYTVRATARGSWPGVTTPPHPPDRPDVWHGQWDSVCR